MTCLSITDLACLRGDRLVFEALSTQLNPGDGLLLTGRNGSGKSSFLRMVSGLLEPFDGTILINGRNPYADWRATAPSVVFVGHEDPVKGALTVQENLSFWASLSEDAPLAKSQLSDIMRTLHLRHLANAPGTALSSGQRRRVSLARLMLSQADLWLMDEPTTGLDTDSVAQIEEVVADHRAKGGIVLLSTHVAFSLPNGRTLDMGDYTPAISRSSQLFPTSTLSETSL